MGTVLVAQDSVAWDLVRCLMAGKKKDANVRSRYFKLLLYADNPVHVAALETLRQIYPSHIGIWHKQYDDDGDVIIQGEGKLHAHICLAFDNPVWVSSVCKKIGLMRDDGEPDTQFVRQITGRFDNMLVYLTHTCCPDKEQYTFEDLFGSQLLIDQQRRACARYLSKQIETPDAVRGLKCWISQQDGIVSASMIIDYVTENLRFFKAASHPLIRAYIDEHNRAFYRANRDRAVVDISEGVGFLSRRVAGGNWEDGFFGVEDLND